jgi:hypothetical protein
MSFLKINAGTPLNNINGSLVNTDNSHVTQLGFSSNVNPSTVNPRVLPEPQSNIQGAASYIPSSQKGGKINRKKINKISRRYKMKGTKRTIRRRIRRMKSRVRSRYSRRSHKRTQRGGNCGCGMKYGGTSSRTLRGGAAVAPNYPGGYTQYQNNMAVDASYATAGKTLPSDLSALANPPPITRMNLAVDNLNHNALNSYGNSGAGSGFPSRGSF